MSDDVDVKAEHWAKLFKLIREEKSKGIALYDLADKLGKERDDPGLAKGIQQLRRQGKIRTSIGRSKDGKVCVVVQPVDDEFSTREEPDDEPGRVD